MIIHPSLAGQLARDRQQEMLAGAEQRRLTRQLHAASREARQAAGPQRPQRSWLLGAAAWLRPAARG
jgi:hypothetical protein